MKRDIVTVITISSLFVWAGVVDNRRTEHSVPTYAHDLDLELRAQHDILDKMIAHSLENMRRIEIQINKAKKLDRMAQILEARLSGSCAATRQKAKGRNRIVEERSDIAAQVESRSGCGANYLEKEK